MNTLLNKIGRIVVNFSMQRFRDQNWLDVSPQQWQQRKRSRGSTRRDRGAILVNTGRLRRSIRIVSLGSYSVIVGTDVPYARALNDGSHETVNVKAHSRQLSHRVSETYTTRKGNERTRTVRQASGETAAVKAHSRKNNLPARQFIGASFKLDREIEPVVSDHCLHAMKTSFERNENFYI